MQVTTHSRISWFWRQESYMAEGSHVSSVNPWSTQDSLLGARLGDPQSGLALARRHGLLGITQTVDEESELRLSKCSSVRMIKALKEISQLSNELHELELEIHRQLLDKDMADFIHIDVLESRLRRVDILLNHLTEVVSEKDKIVGRLQSRAAENSLKIEAPFQEHAKSVLSSLGGDVTHLPSHCKQLEWISELDLLNNTPLNEKLSSGTQSLVQCRSMFQQCQNLHDAKRQQLTQ